MTFETINIVDVYRRLNTAFQEGGRHLHIGILFYFVARQAQPARAFRDGDNGPAFINVALEQLQCVDDAISQQMARKAERIALGVEGDVKDHLVIVGHWSALSYLFRYLQTPDWKWAESASDSFLSAIEQYASEHGPETLVAEIANLSRAHEAAQSSSKRPIVQTARAIVNWAENAPIGVHLPSLDLSR